LEIAHALPGVYESKLDSSIDVTATTPGDVTGVLSRRRLVLLLIGLLCAGFCPDAAAQTVSTYLPPELMQHGNEPRHSLVQLGLFDLNPHVGATALYDDNINLRSTNGQDDFIFVLSPGIDIVKAGAEQDAVTSMRITYNPAFVFFAQHDTNNSVDHFARFNGGVTLARLKVSASQDYESSAGNLVDVGNRVAQTYYRTLVLARYEISEKTSAEIGGSYRITDYQHLIGSEEWNEDNAVQYQIAPKVLVGLGFTVGELTVDDTPPPLLGIGPAPVRTGNTQMYYTPSVRASYRTTEKTDVALSVGGEWRNYQDGRSAFGPVFSLAGNYHPREDVTVSLEGHRREQNSAVLGGQDYITTGFGASGSYQFHERYRAHVSFTYDNAEYQAAKRGITATRVDDYFLLRYGADVILGHSWTLGIFHQYRVNESSSGFNFENNQVGLQTVWAY